MCDLGGSGYCLWGLDRNVCEKSLSNNSGKLRYWCEAIRGEYVKNSTYLYLVFLCIYRLEHLSSSLMCILYV